VIGEGADAAGDLGDGEVAIADAADAQGQQGQVALARQAEALEHRLDKEEQLAVV
jgi:hypothetical protein